MYYFQNADNNFNGYSTVYNVYDDENLLAASIVVGYCNYNNIFYFTEYRGGYASSIISTQSSYNKILYEFSQIFEHMEYMDIFSNESRYNENKDEIPAITKDKLYIYDSFGNIQYKNGEWLIVPDDKFLEYLIDKGMLEDSWVLLEDYDDDDNLLVEMNIYDRDELNGFYLYVKDWSILEQEVLATNN